MATTARHRMVHWCFFHPAPGVSQCPRPFVHCCSSAGGCLSPRCSHVPLDMPDLMPHLHSLRILRVSICFVLRFFFLSARAQDPFLSSATQFCSYFIYFLYSGQLEFMCVHALSKSSCACLQLKIVYESICLASEIFRVYFSLLILKYHFCMRIINSCLFVFSYE